MVDDALSFEVVVDEFTDMVKASPFDPEHDDHGDRSAMSPQINAGWHNATAFG
ncbi:hypothetical protein ACIRQP_32950 [Streptomyces sp. NPDC102274]|uniref:hypothetical protein n=1 Tax=Streptomyces sp. NPDC102274 TaxID=3366151 RepID=UPI00382B0265